MRFFLEFSYNGANYHGWQKQTNVISVQEEINRTLSTILNTDIDVVGAGRTDAGVHAKQMFGHFDCNVDFEFQDLIFKMNSFLPSDIAIKNIFKVSNKAHARFDALSRTYSYNITFNKDPFNKNAYLYKQALDIKSMNDACQYILGNQDFTSFSKINTQNFTNNCNVMFAKWKLLDKDLHFTIKSDRFLRNMVRAIVGTLIDVGLGKIQPEDIFNIIAAKDRSIAGRSVPAHALFLIEIIYPEKLFKLDEIQ